MKRNNKAISPVDSVAADIKPITEQLPPNGHATSQQTNGDKVLKEHRNMMTRGELLFCLRDVHRYWSTPRISPHEIELLEQENLIQRSITGLSAIRLTERGARVKNGQKVET